MMIMTIIIAVAITVQHVEKQGVELWKERPVAGSVVCTQSVILAKGDSGRPLGLKSWVAGRVKGSSFSCTAFGSCKCTAAVSPS